MEKEQLKKFRLVTKGNNLPEQNIRDVIPAQTKNMNYEPNIKIFKEFEPQTNMPLIIQINIGSEHAQKQYGLFDSPEYYMKRYNNFFNFLYNLNSNIIVCVQEATKIFLSIAKIELPKIGYDMMCQLVYSNCVNVDNYVGHSYICIIYKKNISLQKFWSEDINITIRNNYLNKYLKCNAEECKIKFKCKHALKCILCDPKILCGVFQILNHIIVVCNVHLPGESENIQDHEKRIMIIDTIYETLNKYQNFFIVGDFNDEKISEFTKNKNLRYYTHKNNIKTSFHQIITDKVSSPMVKNYDEQREVLDHILHSPNINLLNVSYEPKNGIEIGKQYPYNGLDAVKLFPENIIKSKKELIFKNNSLMPKSDFEFIDKFNNIEKQIISFSDHSLVKIKFKLVNEQNIFYEYKNKSINEQSILKNGRTYDIDSLKKIL